MRLADLLGDLGLGYSVPALSGPDATIVVPDGAEFDIRRVIDDIITNDEPVSSDIKISDRDFPQAPNFFTFCVSDKYLNQKPFLEQALIGTRVLAEYCPKCSDMDWIDHTHKVDDSLHKFERKVALLEKGVCPYCKKTKAHFVKAGLLNHYNEAALAVGQRGGKSAWLGMMAAYLTHLQIKMQKPNEVYGLLRANILHGTFAALTYAQAKDTLWEPYYGHLLDSPWFRGYHAMLDHATERYGDELYKLKDTFVLYRHRRLLVYPAGPDKRTLRGRTRFMACLTGDTLVSTSRGLIRIDQDLIGLRTHVGHAGRNIVNWAPTGPKEVFKLQLKNGLYEKGTANHEFRVLSKDRTKLIWKRLDQISLQDHLVVSLGGEFPEKLSLNYTYTYSRVDLGIEKALMYMLTQSDNGFYLLDVATASGKTYRGVCAAMTGLKRNGIKVSRFKAGASAPMLYKIVDKEKLAKHIKKPLKGKITALRTALVFPIGMTPELAYMLGYLVADGTYSNPKVDGEYGSEITFCSTDENKVQHYIDCFTVTFGIAPRVSSWTTKENVTAYNVVFALEPIKAFFNYVGLTPAWSAIKTVPWSILQSPRNCVAAFLSAAVSCDGSVLRANRLTYSSTSTKLIHHMQLLFIRLGYACNSTVGIKNYMYKLNLCSYDRDLFLRQDWCGLTKRGHHADYVQSGTNYVPVRYRIPGVLSSIGKPVYSKSHFNQESNSEYKALIDNGLTFTQVKSLTPIGIKKVYDLTVDNEVHDFTAGGLVAKNSIDELGWFPNDANNSKVKMNATEVYIALERSLLTVRASAEALVRQGFSNIPTAYFLNISSPSSIRDKIMELVRKAQGSRKIYGTIKPTWEMNPKVPRSALEEEFRKDPVAAMRDYGAEPPLTASPFLGSQAAVEACFSEKLNRVRVTHLQKKSADRTISRYARIERITRLSRPSVLAIDAGYSNNSFACCITSLEEHNYPRISLLVEVMPLPGIPLNYSKIYSEILVPLCDDCNVVLVGADRWNSLKILSDLNEELDVQTVQKSLKYPEMQLFKSYIEDNQILFPLPRNSVDDILKYDQSTYPHCFKDRPEEHFVLQLLTVQDTGSSVVKGDQLTDDLVRAAMLATTLILDPEYEELFAAADRAAPASQSAIGMYKGGSGGSSHGSRSVAAGPARIGVLRSYG